MKALELFLGYSLPQQVGLALVFGVMALISVWIVVMLAQVAKKLRLKRLGPAEFGSDDDDTPVPVKKNPHAVCGNVKDVVLVFRNRDDLKDQISRIRDEAKLRISHITHHELPKEIMQTAEETIASIISQMESGYLTLLKEKGIAAKSDLVTTEQFKLYRIILKAIQPQLVIEARRMMKENGWVKKERDNRFDSYVEEKADGFLKSMTGLLNNYYVIEKPTRTELYDFNMSKALAPHGWRSQICFTIRQFLVITKNWDKEIDKAEEECAEKIEPLQRRMDEEMKSILGSL
jgi:hypothetical protein